MAVEFAAMVMPVKDLPVMDLPVMDLPVMAPPVMDLLPRLGLWRMGEGAPPFRDAQTESE
jgi:hypothetical protein